MLFFRSRITRGISEDERERDRKRERDREKERDTNGTPADLSSESQVSWNGFGVVLSRGGAESESNEMLGSVLGCIGGLAGDQERPQSAQ